MSNNHDMPFGIPVTSKAIQRYTDNKYYIISKLPYSDEYIMLTMERGVVTNTNSVGGSSDLLRLTQVSNIDKSYVYAHSRSGYGGTWEEWLHRINSNNSINRDIVFWRNSSKKYNDYIKFDMTIPESGEFTLMFYPTPTSDPAARITVDNKEIDTINLQNSQGRLMIRKFQSTPGNHAIRIYTSGDFYIYIAGYNAYELKDAPSRVYVDSLGFTGGGKSYISNKGAVDYAFYDADEKVYYGSYHGGERLISEQLIFDGKNTGLPTGEIVVRKSFAIKQVTNINNKFTSNTIYQIRGDGLLEFIATLKGEANLSTAYSAMTTTDNSFSSVLYPKKLDTTVDGEIYLGRSNTVIQENPKTGQRLTTFLTLFENDNNSLGGVFIRRTSGAYNKVYYGKVVQSLENIKELNYQTKWLFE